eukprot:s1562_g8.t2
MRGPPQREDATVLAAADAEQLPECAKAQGFSVEADADLGVTKLVSAQRRLTLLSERDDPDFSTDMLQGEQDPEQDQLPELPAVVHVPTEAVGSKLVFVLGGDVLRETASLTKVIRSLHRPSAEPLTVFHLITSHRHKLQLPSLGFVVRMRDVAFADCDGACGTRTVSAATFHSSQMHSWIASLRFMMQKPQATNAKVEESEEYLPWFGLQDVGQGHEGTASNRTSHFYDIVDSLLDAFESAVDLTEMYLKPMMSGYDGEANVATSAKERIVDLQRRQADLQAQLVIMGPCQAGKTSLTYALVGFAALPPALPSMVTTRWLDDMAAQTPEKPSAPAPAPAAPAEPAPAAEANSTCNKSQLKAVKSERSDLNVAAKAKEDGPSPTRLDALRDEGAKVIADVRAKAVEVAELAAVKAQTAKVRAVESVHSLKAKAGQMRQSVVASASEAKDAGVRRAQMAKEAVGASYTSLRTNGVRSWVSENVQTARSLATAAVQKSRAAAMRQVQWSVDTTKAMTQSVKTGIQTRMLNTKKTVLDAYAKGKSNAAKAVDTAKTKAVEAKDKAKEVVHDKHVQATAAGVVGGAATLGVSGGATGLAAGTVVGGAIGIIPALFTFGLSIPLGAAIGGGAGLAVGAAAGATAGAVSGGAAGYGAYAKRGQINEFRQSTMNKVFEFRQGTVHKVSTSVDAVKGKAVASALDEQFLLSSSSSSRTRLPRLACASPEPQRQRLPEATSTCLMSVPHLRGGAAQAGGLCSSSESSRARLGCLRGQRWRWVQLFTLLAWRFPA